MKNTEEITGVDHSERQTGSHRPLSPATPAEQFFLPKFNSSNISAFALAANLKHIHKTSGKRSTNTSIASVTSDDFHSCAEYIDYEAPKNISVIKEDFLEEQSFYSLGSPETAIMVDTKTENSIKVALDPSQHLYGGIKNVWGFGSTFVLTKPFAKVTEAVASKFLDMATGMEFSGVDEEVKPKLAEIDDTYLNPAISHVVKLMEPVVKKMQGIVHPIAEQVLSTVGFKQIEAAESDKVKKVEVAAPEMTGVPMN